METINEQKEFNCLEMKKDIQAKIYAEIKDMTAEERILYFHIPPEQDPFRGKPLVQSQIINYKLY
jgi:hypothetical protein